MDIIEIDNLRLRCIIGFSPHERKDRQDVIISLRIGTDMRVPGSTDNPDDAFNYRTVTKAIIQHVETSEYYLDETLATAIARICVIDHHAPYVQVRVHKPGALRFADSVGVMIERRPDDF
jgi:FolB domain-containing protein